MFKAGNCLWKTTGEAKKIGIRNDQHEESVCQIFHALLMSMEVTSAGERDYNE